jgi:CDP-diacylglycerol--glycerol-3-phosphate 3-phosphatidyltransferase|tara:strand:- start:18 stop:563 length:546 start_codon:yes stop_codon:yes gene_type:complete
MKLFINFLTISRILLGPIIFILVLYWEAFTASLFLFLFASISDYFDGALARKYNLSSPLGEVLDPIADKILVLFMLFALALYFSSIYIGFISCLMLAREFWVSALRDLNARNLNTSATKVSFLAKIKTTVQLGAVGFYLFGLFSGSAIIIFLGDFILLLALIIAIQTGLTYSLKTFSSKVS